MSLSLVLGPSSRMMFLIRSPAGDMASSEYFSKVSCSRSDGIFSDLPAASGTRMNVRERPSLPMLSPASKIRLSRGDAFTLDRRAPAVLFQESSLVTKLLRDLLTDDYTAIRIDDEQEYRRVVALVERIMPNLLPRVKHYSKEYPIFEEYGVQGEIDKALRPKVWLKSGGYLVINQTEALVAIDVNTGRYVGKKSSGRLEDTIVKTNLEAVKEIVRQIRLRDLGGIIVLDLIDMEDKKNRQKVYQAVEQELKKDRSPSKALQVSDFGLVIITRKRVKQSLERVLTEPCPYCSGTGVIKSSSTICYEILTEVKKVSPELNGHRLLLRVNPDIARALKEEEREVMRDLKSSLGKDVTVKPDLLLHHEQFDVMAV